ncbi:MAG: BrnA antitoxin family protein [Steroidobacteraceae bacterium]
MRKQYDFSKARKAKSVPHLARLQAEATGKTRITIMLDDDLLMLFRTRAESEGTGYQTLINQALRRASGTVTVDESTLRRVIREEIQADSRGSIAKSSGLKSAG